MKITTLQQLNDLIAKELGCYSQYYTLATQELINHIHSLDLELAIYSNKYNCCATIYQMDEDFIEIQQYWDSTCGEHYANTGHCTIDSPINSVPLAICLAFLKYKDIEVELKIDDTI